MNAREAVFRRFKSAIKYPLSLMLHDGDGMRDVRVLSGPCRGVRLRIDIRTESAYWLGTYDRKIVQRITSLLREGMTAWDCGAFLGYYAAAMRLAVGATGRVHLFEGSPINMSRVSELPRRNGWDNVTCHHLAIGKDHDTVEFATNLGAASGLAGAHGKVIDAGSKPEVQEVRSHGIDELIDEHGIDPPDFLKLDLETGERWALRNGTSLWSSRRPTILVELHRSAGDEPLAAHESAAWFLEEFDYAAEDVRTNRPIQSINDILDVESRGTQSTLLMKPRQESKRPPSRSPRTR